MCQQNTLESTFSQIQGKNIRFVTNFKGCVELHTSSISWEYEVSDT